jgi:ABC-type sugar transport system ATPase subunit
VTHLDPKDRDVAMVFQSYALYPNMNVYENIRFPLKVRGIDPATHDEKVRRASAMVELDDFLHRKPAELSGGQRQRVALARAIVRQPNVFLMDEPLSNLDAKLRVSTRAQIKNLSHELAVTTVYVTHDQIEAMTLADRVVVMKGGVVQQVGSPTDIYDHPANTFVASFIGNPAMNLMEGSECGNFSAELDQEFRTKQPAAFAADPALYQIGGVSNGTVTPLLNEGTIRPLDDLVAAYGQDLSPNQLIRVDGQIMAVAMMVNTQHLMYRQDIFDDLGLDVPTTWEEVIIAAEAIQKLAWWSIRSAER